MLTIKCDACKYDFQKYNMNFSHIEGWYDEAIKEKSFYSSSIILMESFVSYLNRSAIIISGLLINKFGQMILIENWFRETLIYY